MSPSSKATSPVLAAAAVMQSPSPVLIDETMADSAGKSTEKDSEQPDDDDWEVVALAPGDSVETPQSPPTGANAHFIVSSANVVVSSPPLLSGDSSPTPQAEAEDSPKNSPSHLSPGHAGSDLHSAYESADEHSRYASPDELDSSPDDNARIARGDRFGRSQVDHSGRKRVVGNAHRKPCSGSPSRVQRSFAFDPQGRASGGSAGAGSGTAAPARANAAAPSP